MAGIPAWALKIFGINLSKCWRTKVRRRRRRRACSLIDRFRYGSHQSCQKIRACRAFGSSPCSHLVAALCLLHWPNYIITVIKENYIQILDNKDGHGQTISIVKDSRHGEKMQEDKRFYLFLRSDPKMLIWLQLQMRLHVQNRVDADDVRLRQRRVFQLQIRIKNLLQSVSKQILRRQHRSVNSITRFFADISISMPFFWSTWKTWTLSPKKKVDKDGEHVFPPQVWIWERESFPAGGVDKKAGSLAMLRLKIRFFWIFSWIFLQSKLLVI